MGGAGDASGSPEREPTDLQSRRALVASHLGLSQVQQAEGHPGRAMQSADQALAIAQVTLGRSPNSAGARRDLEAARERIAQLRKP